MRRNIVGLLIGSSFVLGPHGHAQTDVAQTIIAMERAALDRWGKGDPQGFFEIMAPGQTYFDPMTEKRIDGQPDLKRYMAPFTGKIRIERIEMIDPRVQQSGDMAVLTFNLNDYGSQVGDGPKGTSRWNSTEVFQRINGSWKIIHSHWSLLKPELNESSEARSAAAQAIRESEIRLAKASEAKDVDKMMSHYADGAFVELSGVPIVSGKDAIRARFTETMAKDPSFALSFAPIQVEVSRGGDLAYTRGTYTTISTDPAMNRPVTAHGKYIIVYRKAPDGRWLAIHDINNRDGPATPTKP